MPSSRTPSLLIPVASLALLAALVGCGPSGGGAGAASAPLAAKPALLLAPEDLLTLQPSRMAQGPVITGAVMPERRADLRAEVAAVVVQVLKDNGETVRAGELLMRLDDTAIRDSLASAEEALRASSQAFEQAERQVARFKTLQAQGMTSTQALEDAEVRRNNAQSDLVAARSRVVGARQQMQRTAVRAPFDGVVSERKASSGDTAQVGKELVKVIDPRSMRFEGLVSADRLAELKLGQAVRFRINGVTEGDFAGKVERIDASVNTATRQVAVAVAFAEPARAPKVAGLFAEGRVETGSAQVLALPENALVRSGEAAHVWRVQGTQLAKVAVRLGERDARTGEVPVLSGLAAGDRLLRNPGSTVSDGQAVEFAKAAPVAAPATAAPASAAAK
ncbi:MAG: efflux RND transporter periplasmic adaptor subunit [Rubrivivax sp.]|nr:efflux RND transporter periplasmic adaptor subunit [Rubrivivax sp.]